MKTLAALLALPLLMPLAFAQKTNESPKPAPEMDRLIKMWAGHWTTEELFEPSDEMPKGKQDKGAETMRSGPGGFSLIGDYESHGAHFGHLVVTWIPAEKVYKSYWTDLTQPGVSVSTGKWEGEKLVFTSIDESTGKKILNRDTYSDITQTSFTDTLESGPLGGPLKKILTVKYAKQKDTAYQKDSSIGSGELFNASEQLVEDSPVEESAAKNHGVDFLGAVNVIERIGIE
jgi:hypothetical protein